MVQVKTMWYLCIQHYSTRGSKPNRFLTKPVLIALFQTTCAHNLSFYVTFTQILSQFSEKLCYCYPKHNLTHIEDTQTHVIYIYICLHFYPFIYRSIDGLIIYESIDRSIYPSIYPSVCLSVCLSVYLSLSLFIYLPTYLPTGKIKKACKKDIRKQVHQGVWTKEPGWHKHSPSTQRVGPRYW